MDQLPGSANSPIWRPKQGSPVTRAASSSMSNISFKRDSPVRRFQNNRINPLWPEKSIDIHFQEWEIAYQLWQHGHRNAEVGINRCLSHGISISSINMVSMAREISVNAQVAIQCACFIIVWCKFMVYIITQIAEGLLSYWSMKDPSANYIRNRSS